MNFSTNDVHIFQPSINKGELSMADIQKLISNREDNGDHIIAQHSEVEIKKLEEFCIQHGIIGFNCGNMSPMAALQILKRKIGVVDHITPTSPNNKKLLFS